MAMLIFTPGCMVRKSGENSVSSAFDGEIKVKVGQNEYECELIHTPEQVSHIEITKPDKLNGLSFAWEGDKNKILWKDLECEFNKDVLPQMAFVKIIVNVLNSVADKENLKSDSENGEESVLSGKCKDGDFKITVNKKGTIKHISVPSALLEADFITCE